jgi:hypothetical protein
MRPVMHRAKAIAYRAHNTSGESLMNMDPVNAPTRPDFKLLAIVEDERTKQFSCVVQFSSIFGDSRRVWIKRADFEDIKLLDATLRNKGAEFSIDTDINTEAIKALISSSSSVEKWKISLTTGWRDNNKQFVLPFEVVGTGDPNVRVCPPGEDDEGRAFKIGRSGTLVGWQKRVAKPARHSTRMVMGICAAFAAPLLKISGQNSFGIQVSGPPKTAKSTALLAAASVIGFARENDLPNFRATDTALGELAENFNDCLLPLNELALLKGNDRARQQVLREFTYGLAEGKGTIYSKHFTQNSPQQWRSIALSNSEEAAEEIALKAGVTRMGGEAVRWIDVPAVRKGRRTIFDLAPDDLIKEDEAAWAKATCRKLRKAIERNHGVAISKFVERMLARPEHIAGTVDNEARLFVEDVSRKSDSPPLKHLASSFAHIYSAGALAVELRILRWKKGFVLKCVKQCYRDAKRALRTPEELQRRGLELLLKHVDSGKFVKIGKRPPKMMQDACGFFVTTEGEQKVTIRAKNFKALFSDRRQPRLVLDWLHEHGGVTPTSTGKPNSANDLVWAETQKTWPDGKRVRSIVIDLSPKLRELISK